MIAHFHQSLPELAKELLGDKFDHLFIHSAILLNPIENHALLCTASRGPRAETSTNSPLRYVLRVNDNSPIKKPAKIYDLMEEQFQLFHIILSTWSTVGTSNSKIRVLNEIRSYGFFAVPPAEFFANFLFNNSHLEEVFLCKVLAYLVRFYKTLDRAQPYLDQYIERIMACPEISFEAQCEVLISRASTMREYIKLRNDGYVPLYSVTHYKTRVSELSSTLSPEERKVALEQVTQSYAGKPKLLVRIATIERNEELLLAYLADSKMAKYHEIITVVLTLMNPAANGHLLAHVQKRNLEYHYAMIVYRVKMSDVAGAYKIYQQVAHFPRLYNWTENLMFLMAGAVSKLQLTMHALRLIDGAIILHEVKQSKHAPWSHLQLKLKLLREINSAGLIEFAEKCLSIQCNCMTSERRTDTMAYIVYGYFAKRDHENSLKYYGRCEKSKLFTPEWKEYFLKWVFARRNDPVFRSKRTREIETEMDNKVLRLK